MLGNQKGKLLDGYMAEYVVFDLETTGISWKLDEVIEISAVKVKSGKVVEEFNTLVNPGCSIPYGASQVNGITDEMVKNAPSFEMVLKDFLSFIGNMVLVGHNIARFDMNFIYRDSKKFFGQIPDNDYLDTLLTARKNLPSLKHHRLTDLAAYYGISAKGAHRALNDCYMNQQIYERMEKPQHRTMKIRGVVERITYQNPENGYTVLKCAVKNYSELVTVVGSLLDVNVGSVLLIDGNWKVDSKYGRQFMAETWEETMPATIYGIEKYLGSGLIKGVGPKFAKRIVQKFGTDTIDVIETDIYRLREVDGIGEKRIKKIHESWEKQKEIKNVMLFLQAHGVSTSYAAKIYKQYGNESVDRMKENPFRLADDIWGIGFKTADMIAEKLGFGKEAFVRLRSGLMYTLSALADEGHVYAQKSQLVKKASELLEASDSCIVMTLDHMLKEQDLIFEKVEQKGGVNGEKEVLEAIYLPAFYYAEIGVAGKLKKLSAAPARDMLWTRLQEARKKTGKEDLSVDVEHIQKKTGVEYDEIQADAIRKAAVSKVMVLTGGPGTGKTTTIQGIIAAYRAFGLKILLAAPTGRAAKRMTEATGLEAKTLHRLLECKPPEGYQKNEEQPLEGDVLIVDECSMIDIILMNSLLKAIPEHMRLVLVGDIDQLPSVGAGNVLRDIIDSECFPVICLTRIFRQAQTSRIIMNAHRVNEGKMPDISNGNQTDFFFMQREEPEEAVRLIVDLVKNKLSQYYQTPPELIQVLTPMQRGVVGAANMNLALQDALNPQGEGLRRSGVIYRQNEGYADKK